MRVYHVRTLGVTNSGFDTTATDSVRDALQQYCLSLPWGSLSGSDGVIFESHGHEHLAHVHGVGTVLISAVI